MIRINLLPHREMRRERRKKDFIGVCALTGIVGAALAFAVGMGINQQIENQDLRNEFIKTENGKLDAEIKEIASLRGEIEALKARQEAVENLQSDRTTPVHLLDELVRATPEGVFMKTLRQEDRRLLLTGYAQSNDRISELLRNLGAEGQWLERPELIEIKATQLGAANAKEARSVFEFGMTVQVRKADRKPAGDKNVKGAGVAGAAVPAAVQVAAQTPR